MNNQVHILIVDDDLEIRTLLGDFLKQYDYLISLATNGKEMLHLLSKKHVDLIILDVMLPGEDGFMLCRRLRENNNNIPIIMLTAAGEETDRIVGLELGADDYLAKPFNPRELLARIKAVLRRSKEPKKSSQEHPKSTMVTFADWKLDLATRRLLSPDNVEITLSSGEFDLLATFIEYPKHILNRDQLMDITRHRLAGPFDRSIDVQVSRLRHKIEKDSKNPQLIKTVRNGGYLFTPDVKRL